MYEREKIKDIGIDYCGFTIEQLVEDHKEIKKQIKRWEKIIDKFLSTEDYIRDELYNELQEISNEMMSINM